MDLLREKLKASARARLLGGGGGGGGAGGDTGIGSEADPGTGGAPPGSPSGPAAGIGGSSGGAPGIGLGVTNPSTIALGVTGMLMGLPTTPMNAVATVGNAINSATGFAGGTPSADASAPGGFMDATGWGGPGGGLTNGIPANDPYMIEYNRLAPIFGDAYARQVLAARGLSPGQTFGAAVGAPPAAAPAAAAPVPTGGGASGTPEEQALRQAQLELVNQQRQIASEMLRRQNLLEGEQLRAQGYEQVLGPDGQVTGYRMSDAAAEQKRVSDEINNLMRTRTLSALRGELPVDPALERSIGENRATLEAQLRGNLGSGFATSTPGISSLADFDKRAEELRMAMRRDQLTAGEGIRLAGEDLNNRISSSRFSNIAGLSSLPTAGAGILSAAGAGLTPSLQNILGGRGLDTQWNLGNLNAETQRAIAMLQGQMGMRGQQMQLDAADNAGMGQLLGGLGSAFIRSDTFGDMMGGAGNWLGGLFGGGGGGEDVLGAFGSGLGLW